MKKTAFIVLVSIISVFANGMLAIDFIITESGTIEKGQKNDTVLNNDKNDGLKITARNNSNDSFSVTCKTLRDALPFPPFASLSIPPRTNIDTLTQFKGGIKHPFKLLIVKNGKQVVDSVVIRGVALAAPSSPPEKRPQTASSNEAANPKKPNDTINLIAATGIPFYDALTISKYFRTDAKQIVNILKRYKIDNTSYADNPFIKDEKLDSISRASLKRIESTGAEASFQLSSSLSGLNVTNLADGMARFLVKRTKQEMTVAFFDSFKKFIEDDAYVEMRKLFPSTYSTLSAIDKDIYNFDAYMQTIRESFEKDLSGLLDNFPGVIRNDSKGLKPDQKGEILVMLYLATALQHGEHPGKIIKDFPMDDLDSMPSFKGSLQTLQLVSESLRDFASGSDTGAYWVAPSDFKNLIRDSVALRIYLGLIYQQAQHAKIRFTDKLTLCDILKPIGENFTEYYASYRDYFSGFCRAAGELSSVIQKYRNMPADSLASGKYVNYVNAFANLAEAALDWKNLIPRKGPSGAASADTLSAKIKKLVSAARSASSIAADVSRRNYASVIVNVFSLYKSCVPENSETAPAMKQFLKYGTFMATVVQAKSADEIESVIEAFALPAGSASIKRNASFNVAVNAYVGLFLGNEKEWRDNVPPNMEQVGGIAAPIGIAFSTAKWPALYPLNWVTSDLLFLCNLGLKEVNKSPASYNPWFSSFSVFCSAIDIGAVTAYRFQNDSVSNLPELKLENIFAPGIYGIFGMSGVPISIGAGVQSGPQLRSVKDSAATIKNINGFRWSIFIAADIPLLTIYTKPLL